MTTPNSSASSAINSPLIGQPMNSSYETQWLGSVSNASEDRLRRRSSQGGSNSEAVRGRSQSLAKRPATKAERRALQEKQRLEKQKRVSATAASSTINAPNALDKKPSINNQLKSKGFVATKSDHHQQKKSILNYLELPKKPDTDKNKDLHPAVLSLALLFSQYKIVGSNARCVAVLETFSQVIKDHCPPANATFVRHIQKHLDPHIAFLFKFRYMSLSIRECIRWLKKVMADLVAMHPPVSDQDAQQMLQDRIARFIRERITMADEIITQYALTKIEDGDVVLTFAKSSVIERIFLEAKKAGKDFQVIIIDSRPLLEGTYIYLYVFTDYNCLQLFKFRKKFMH
jgi:translation initiation factor eIF-2B subunit delta